jgi:hypothetical protein
MKLTRIDPLLQCIFLLGSIIASCGNAWAASSNCAYPTSGMDTGGTGMGGTGDVAEGTGMGGTGITLGVYINEMQLAGNVTISQGAVEAQSNGNSRFLAKGDPICVGDTIKTSQSGSVQIRMTDGGLIALRPQTQIKIEKFLYRGTNKDSSLLTLLNGACHIIAGKIGQQHPQNNTLKTPTSTIGVSGADHEATVILPSDSGGYPPGTYDKVNHGTTFIRTEKGEVDIHPNEVGFAAGSGELPILLEEMPVFYNTNPSGNPSE